MIMIQSHIGSKDIDYYKVLVKRTKTTTLFWILLYQSILIMIHEHIFLR